MATPEQENQITGAASQAVETAKEVATETMQAGENCVSEHPASAISTTFVSGLLIGVVVGWAIAESRHHHYRNVCRQFATEWLDRLHLA